MANAGTAMTTAMNGSAPPTSSVSERRNARPTSPPLCFSCENPGIDTARTAALTNEIGQLDTLKAIRYTPTAAGPR
jgi:hypothetical protein